jgi:hypothetical protein
VKLSLDSFHGACSSSCLTWQQHPPRLCRQFHPTIKFPLGANTSWKPGSSCAIFSWRSRKFRVALEDQCFAMCAFLPVRELRAFSVLTSRFRSASTLAWSDDILENERVLLAIVQNGQPQFLSKAINDSGIGSGSLGRFLLRATDAGGQCLCDHWWKLLGDLHAVIRLEDAVSQPVRHAPVPAVPVCNPSPVMMVAAQPWEQSSCSQLNIHRRKHWRAQPWCS